AATSRTITRSIWHAVTGVPSSPRRHPRSGVPAPVAVSSSGLGERSQRLLEALLLGAILRPVAAAQRLLGAVVDLERALRGAADGGRPGGPRRARRRRADRGRDRGRPAPEDPRPGPLERRLHRDLVAVGHA